MIELVDNASLRCYHDDPSVEDAAAELGSLSDNAPDGVFRRIQENAKEGNYGFQ